MLSANFLGLSHVFMAHTSQLVLPLRGTSIVPAFSNVQDRKLRGSTPRGVSESRKLDFGPVDASSKTFRHIRNLAIPTQLSLGGEHRPYPVSFGLVCCQSSYPCL